MKLIFQYLRKRFGVWVLVIDLPESAIRFSAPQQGDAVKRRSNMAVIPFPPASDRIITVGVDFKSTGKSKFYCFFKTLPVKQAKQRKGEQEMSKGRFPFFRQPD